MDVSRGGAVVGAFVIDHNLSKPGGNGQLSCQPEEKNFLAPTFSVTAESRVSRPPVAKALSQRCAMPSTSLSCIQLPHGLPCVE